MSVFERLKKALSPYQGAEDCLENRAKMAQLILEELPDLTNAEVEAGCTAILGVKHDQLE